MFNQERMLLNNSYKQVIELEIPLSCTICSKFVNDKCSGHDAMIDSIELVIKPMAWMKQHQIKADSYKQDESGNITFSLEDYFSKCLMEIIVEAPWGITNEIFLLQVGPDLGGALETLVPGLGSDSNDRNKNIEAIKKVQSELLEG